MRIIVIPDVHLKPWMFESADKILGEGEADRAVVLGDLVDDWNCENNVRLYKDTLGAALLFQKDHPDTLWCKGNHDMSYLWTIPCSGTSHNLNSQDAAISGLCELYFDGTDNSDKPVDKKTTAFVHKVDNVLFSHAGVSRMFVKEQCKGISSDNIDAVLSRINSLGEEKLWYDDSPIWLRPQKEYAGGRTLDMYKPRTFLQVVGHTPVRKITQEKNIVSCDTFSLYRNGLPIGDEEFCVVDTVSKKWESVPSEKRNTLKMWSLLTEGTKNIFEK